ncbi:MAG TPA: DUF2786 domain-containing protein [Acidimicrobiales bacterium]|nr:DUF2786 domain-containing protein [Acidimicrobiales bacterium]
MGTRNRQRRREKQRRRAVTTPPSPPGGDGSPGTGRRRGDARGDRFVDDAGAVAAEVVAAAEAFSAGDTPGYGRSLARLGLDPAAVPPVPARVGQVIDQAAGRALARAWELGWQPADVDRVVRRRRRASHAEVVAAAMADQHRAYAAATVDPAWRDQLRQLGADPWAPPAPPPAPAPPPGTLPLHDPGDPADLHDDGRVAQRYRALIETLALLWHLPTLPRLLPLPGQAHPASSAGRAVDARILERVRALLAKAESTTFSGEADAFTAKAQELMARHAVDRAMVDAAGTGAGHEEPTGRRIGIDDPYAQAKSLLLAVVARANRCRAVWCKGLGFSTVFGHQGDLAGVDLLYTSLLVQATAAMAAAGRRTDGSGRSRTRSFRNSFLVAYANRIGQRLRESARAAEAAGAEEHGAALVPVLVARTKAVDEAMTAAYPDAGRYSGSISNGAGWAAGTAAADLARLSALEEVRSA